jgi:hypothetical protein
MGRMYSATFEEVAVTAAQDLFELVAPSDLAVVIHGMTFSQSTDAGDSESEQLNILIHRGTTSGSGGSTPTPNPMVVSTTASTVTVEANNNTTQSTEGAILHAECFNVMSGFVHWWPPETRPVISPSGRLIVELQTAPDDSINMSGTIYFEEIGG